MPRVRIPLLSMKKLSWLSPAFLLIALALSVHGKDSPMRGDGATKRSLNRDAASNDLPKTFEEKKKIAVGMKKISKQLDVKCAYCHTDADRGLKEGDFTILTKEGEYAHEVMFPLSDTFKVECSFCHAGGSEMTEAGERSHQDMKFISRYKKQHKKNLQCTSCHIPGEKGSEFKKFTAFS
jgi:hypothetical protein